MTCLDTSKPIYVVQGLVTDEDAHNGKAKLGDTEWQFSDGPPGERGTSEDYLDLFEGIRAYPDAQLIFDLEPVSTRSAPQWVWNLLDDIMDRATSGDLDGEGDLIIEGADSGPERNQVSLLAAARRQMKEENHG